MMFQHPPVRFLPILILPLMATDALCPAGFSFLSKPGLDLRSRLLEQQTGADPATNPACVDTLDQVALPSDSFSPFPKTCKELIERFPCDSRIKPAGNLEVNLLCANTCNACDSLPSPVIDETTFPYTKTYAPPKLNNHYTEFTVEEDTIHVKSIVPHDTDYFGFIINDYLAINKGTMYTISLKPTQDENGDRIYTIDDALYYDVKSFGPAPDNIKERLQGLVILECQMDIYVATGNGTFCDIYDDDEEKIDLIMPIIGPAHVLVLTGVPESSTDAMNIVSVSQDESQVMVSWNVKRTSTFSSPHLEVGYAGKPTSYDGSSYYDVAGLEYHGEHRVAGQFSFLPFTEDQWVMEEGEEEANMDTVPPSASPSVVVTTTTTGTMPPSSVDDSSVAFSVSSSFLWNLAMVASLCSFSFWILF